MDLKIVIIGAGEVGFNLAKSLSKQNYDITVIDIDSKKCLKVKNTLDVHVIEGDGCSQRVLQSIGMNDVDYLLALTGIDEINLVSSQIAKKIGAKHVICRLRNTEYSHKDAIATANEFGIDHVVYPEKAAQAEIEHLVRQSSAVEVQEFMDGNIVLVGVDLESSSPLIGRSVENIVISNPYVNHSTVMINRDDNFFIPKKTDLYQKNDHAYFIGRKKDIDSIQLMAGKPSFNVSNIIILGAGKIGRLLAKSLQHDYDVRIVETNEEKAKIIGSKLSDSLMLIGNGLDIDFLESENISDVDCFIAATENEQTNMLASLLAKQYGAKQVVLHINTTNYLKAVRRIGADAIISKNISAVNEVLKIIRSDQDQLPVYRFDDIEVEAIDLVVNTNSEYLTKGYTVSKIEEQGSLACIIRDGEYIVPDFRTEVLENDELLIFAKPKNVSDIESLFN